MLLNEVDGKEIKVMLLTEDILDSISEKRESKKGIKILKKIKKILKNSDRKDLLRIMIKLLNIINYDKNMLANMQLENMTDKHLRKFIKNLIKRNDEKLNKESLFILNDI
jgi:hypothetical protein